MLDCFGSNKHDFKQNAKKLSGALSNFSKSNGARVPLEPPLTEALRWVHGYFIT